MTKDEALKLAEQSIKDLIYALAEGRITGDDYQPVELEAFSVLDAIKEALAQPAQEPVGMVKAVPGYGYEGDFTHCVFAEEDVPAGTNIYITPQQRPWAGLTDDEASWCQAPSTIQTWKRIEAKLKEKNT
jgi:hypothetical protein